MTDQTSYHARNEGVPTPIVELCNSLTDFVERAVGIRPDYTPETLPLVDHYVRLTRESLAERPEVLDLAAQAIGAYFGEVVRRNLIGFWLVPTPNYHDWLLCGQAAFVAINPIGVGYESLLFGGEHHGPSSQLKLAEADRTPIAERLASLPEPTEDEYYSLSTRYDVLQIVYEAVHAQAESRGFGEEEFTPADYGAAPPVEDEWAN